MAKKKKEDAAPADGNAPRFAPPDPAPKIGERVNYILPGDGSQIAPATVGFVHEGLDGRVVNLAVQSAEGAQEVVGVAYYPAPFTPDGGDKPEQPSGNTWHREGAQEE